VQLAVSGHAECNNRQLTLRVNTLLDSDHFGALSAS